MEGSSLVFTEECRDGLLDRLDADHRVSPRGEEGQVFSLAAERYEDTLWRGAEAVHVPCEKHIRAALMKADASFLPARCPKVDLHWWHESSVGEQLVSSLA